MFEFAVQLGGRSFTTALTFASQFLFQPPIRGCPRLRLYYVNERPKKNTNDLRGRILGWRAGRRRET